MRFTIISGPPNYSAVNQVKLQVTSVEQCRDYFGHRQDTLHQHLHQWCWRHQHLQWKLWWPAAGQSLGTGCLGWACDRHYYWWTISMWIIVANSESTGDCCSLLVGRDKTSLEIYRATIQPIALPSTSQLWDQFTGEWALAAGFGYTFDGQTGISMNSLISHVNIQVISVAQCQASFGHWAQASNICTNGAGGIGICHGDSGGPLLVNRWGQNILVGISSFVADTGCQQGHPSVFARVTSFYNFIVQHL